MVRELLSEDRDTEYFTREGLTTMTGLIEGNWKKAIVKELIDNALDAIDDAGVDDRTVTVTYDNGLLVSGHASIQTTLDRYGHLIREVNTEQVRRLENMLGSVENFDSLSDTEEKSVRRMLEDFGKNDSEGFVQPLPHKDLEAVVHA